MDTHQVCCNFADHVFVTRIKEDALMVATPQSVPTAPSMHRHTMRVVLVIKCIKLVLDAIRDWANVYYLIIKKLYGEVLINNT